MTNPFDDPKMKLHEKILLMIQRHDRKGLPAPTYTQMCDEIGQSSKQGPARKVDWLVKHGYLVREPRKANGLALTTKGWDHGR